MNYYYDLPQDLIKYIESFMKTKPEQLQNLIDNPPMYLLKMCRPYHEKKPHIIKSFGSEERLDEYNSEIKFINSNRIKFFLEFNIKKIRETHIPVKRLKKYNLVEPNMNNDGNLYLSKNLQRKQLNGEDHVNQFDTYDGKIIIISSPYYKCDSHIEYGYTLYHKPLYNTSCHTYYIIID